MSDSWFVIHPPYHGEDVESITGPFATEEEAEAYIARELNHGYVVQAQRPKSSDAAITEPAMDSLYVYEIKEAGYALSSAADDAHEAVYDMRKNAPELMTPEEHAERFTNLDAACRVYLERREATRAWVRP